MQCMLKVNNYLVSYELVAFHKHTLNRYSWFPEHI